MRIVILFDRCNKNHFVYQVWYLAPGQLQYCTHEWENPRRLIQGEGKEERLFDLSKSKFKAWKRLARSQVWQFISRPNPPSQDENDSI